MRINTSDQYEYRIDLYEKTADRLGETYKAKGIDRACWFTEEMLRNLGEALEHPDMTPALAEVLSTKRVQLSVEDVRRTELRVGNDDE